MTIGDHAVALALPADRARRRVASRASSGASSRAASRVYLTYSFVTLLALLFFVR